MTCLPFKMIIAATSLAISAPAMADASMRSEEVVRGFLQEVRSGRNPDGAARYMAEQVIAHQITSEAETAVRRTPPEYAAHVREFIAAFGSFELTIEQLFARDGLVFVRWRQNGRHLRSLAGETPSGAPLTELTSVVYKVRDGRIVEYWLQSDRKGLELQLQRIAPR